MIRALLAGVVLGGVLVAQAGVTSGDTVAPLGEPTLTVADRVVLEEICQATKESGDPRFVFDVHTGACARGHEYSPKHHENENTLDRSIWLLYIRNHLCLGADRVLAIHRTNKHTGKRYFRYTEPELFDSECPFTDFVEIVSPAVLPPESKPRPWYCLEYEGWVNENGIPIFGCN